MSREKLRDACDGALVKAGAFKEGVAYHWAVAREALHAEKQAPKRDPFMAFAPSAELPRHLADLQRSLLATQWREHLARVC